MQYNNNNEAITSQKCLFLTLLLHVLLSCVSLGFSQAVSENNWCYSGFLETWPDKIEIFTFRPSTYGLISNPRIIIVFLSSRQNPLAILLSSPNWILSLAAILSQPLRKSFQSYSLCPLPFMPPTDGRATGATPRIGIQTWKHRIKQECRDDATRFQEWRSTDAHMGAG